MNIVLRNLTEADYRLVVGIVDEWWGGRPVAGLLPRLFFSHFQPTSFVAETERELAGFLIGFVSQTDPQQAYIHF